jgi:hypothetical protein
MSEKTIKETLMSLEEHLSTSIINAENSSSKISKRVLSINGMTGAKTRHFYNNLCSMDDTRYLEIGTWRGSSICSAIYRNKLSAICIDDFSEGFDIWDSRHPRDELNSNIERFKRNNDIRFIESSCWDVDVDSLPKFNIYMYDGDHEEEAQFKALDHFLNCLDDEFIFVVDDWNWEEVQKGTRRAIRELGIETIFEKEVTWDGDIERDGWWNGVGTFVLKMRG